MDNVRVVWHRAQKMAGITKPKSEAQLEAQAEAQVKAELTRAQKDEAWEIVHPKEDTDVNEAMRRLVSTMRAYHSKHADKFTGDTGMAWRDWLAKAPRSNPTNSIGPRRKARVFFFGPHLPNGVNMKRTTIAGAMLLFASIANAQQSGTSTTNTQQNCIETYIARVPAYVD